MKLGLLLLLSLSLHAAFVAGWQLDAFLETKSPETIEIRMPAQVREVAPEQIAQPPKNTKSKASASRAVPRPSKTNLAADEVSDAKKPAYQEAPAPPSAEEWQRASTYKLKNSKRYRHNWGQQVRSMMGTAVEGPEQGMVRFRIEVAPDGTLADIKELWTTSASVSKRAMQAIKSLPPLPPTPTGKPLIFDRTISFMPYDTGWPPSYTLDCLPDPPAFKNPFAWDGKSPQEQVVRQVTKRDTAEAEASQEKCVTDSTAESIEEEQGELKRQMEINRWGR